LILDLRGLTKNFGGLCALNHVSFSVPKGQVRSVIGPNGAGKTTLFNLISGALAADEGDIFFGGRKINGFPPHRLCRQGMARSFQITNIFQSLTTFENVRLSSQGQVRKLLLFGSVDRLVQQRDETREILELVGLWNERNELAGNLSHGDQRHLEIGIALASKPSLLLLDEPTAGMTIKESRGTIELIKRLQGVVTILLIEHDMELVFEVSEGIVVLHQGQVLAEGNPDKIRLNKDVQRAYLGGDI
jgi:branched-chain amino acid transport system ATP-binding protein